MGGRTVYGVSVVRTQALRRWLVVAVAVGVAVSLPPALAALPAHGSQLSAAELRQRILASDGQPYQGFAQSTGHLAVPTLPQLSDVTTLLNSTLRMRVWYATRDQWRVDEIGLTGAERDVFRLWGGVEYVWDYGANSLTEVIGDPPLRLPRAADLVPPELARRVLGLAAGDPVSALPPRRVAGVDAAGLRLTPADPETTIGAVDIWADPATGLAVQVDVIGRGASAPVLSTRFLDLEQRLQRKSVLQPPPISGSSGFTTTDTPDLISAVGNLGIATLPADLAGRPRRPLPAGFGTVGAYGTGLAAFVVFPLPRGMGGTVTSALRAAGGTALQLASGGTGLLFSTPLVSVAVVRFPQVRRAYLLAGLVTPTLLKQAVTDLDGRIVITL